MILFAKYPPVLEQIKHGNPRKIIECKAALTTFMGMVGSTDSRSVQETDLIKLENDEFRKKVMSFCSILTNTGRNKVSQHATETTDQPSIMAKFLAFFCLLYRQD